MLSLRRSLLSTPSAATRSVTLVARIHTARLVELHGVLHPEEKEQLQLRGLRLHGCAARECKQVLGKCECQSYSALITVKVGPSLSLVVSP